MTLQSIQTDAPAHDGTLRHASRDRGLFPSILDTIGRTPIVRINNLGPRHVELYAKLEAFNPMSSVKDRLALAVIEAAERSGDLKPGQTVIEATSGNTGIALAMVCAQKGHPLVIVMAENFSIERRVLMRFLGAKVILTPAAERATGMMATAERLATAHGWFLCRQFENNANIEAHRTTTAREILTDFSEEGLDYWVSGFGTAGTLKGVAEELKRKNPATQIVAVEPENAQMLNSDVLQPRLPDGRPARSHPNSRAHPIQGWSPDFVSIFAEQALSSGLIDRFQPVSGADALQVARRLAALEGIFCGPSGGATMAAALEVAKAAPDGARILAMIPDTGERYLTTPLFDDVPVTMTAEEAKILASVPKPPRQQAQNRPDQEPAIPPQASVFVAAALADTDAPVVMFGFEWCEFCWSVRKIFDRAAIPFQAIDVDSAELRKGDAGGQILRALFARTGMRTVPQVFIGGELVGGATEVLNAFEDRTLHARLAALPRPIRAQPVEDPLSLLPQWLNSTKGLG
ncbi:pyridoxal-phosphate dependent enzyme [uncultured Roseobacter sp.]|uniref:pyridoxal-phosphate dependent enzyme n=1 Tax=uncultured Roseobacter sp. TaxID=114847 RepID=UPI00345D5DE1